VALFAGLLFGQKVKHKFLTLVENRDSLVYIDQFDPANNWSVGIGKYGKNCDIQLIGNNQVMISYQGMGDKYETQAGYTIHDMSKKGALVPGEDHHAIIPWGHETACQRMPNGHTRLFRNHWTDQGPAPVALTWYDVDQNGQNIKVITSWLDNSKQPAVGARMTRMTAEGTYTFGRTNVKPGTICEGDSTGKILREIKVPVVAGGSNSGCLYKVVKLKNGNYLTSTGHCGTSLLEYSTSGTLIKTYKLSGSDATTVSSYFWGFFEILENGNFMICNWRGHDANSLKSNGYALFEIDPNGKLVWKWRDPANKFSCHKVLCLDGIDPQYRHYDVYGVLTRVEGTTVAINNNISVKEQSSSRYLVTSNLSSISVPSGVKGLKVYTIQGKKIWELNGIDSKKQKNINIPKNLGHQMVQIRFEI
jgi:hypothetical protein